MQVKYWWTEDGDGELCERKECILEEGTECYHCMAKLPKGAMVSVLTSMEDEDRYFMCTACANKNSIEL